MRKMTRTYKLVACVALGLGRFLSWVQRAAVRCTPSFLVVVGTQ